MGNRRELEKRLEERYIGQGLDVRKAAYRASRAVDEINQKKYTKEYFLKEINEKDYILQRLCEHIVLRPNDNKLHFGEIGFNNMINAVEETLEKQKGTDLYNYYYDMKNSEHNFNTFERWLKWGRE